MFYFSCSAHIASDFDSVLPQTLCIYMFNLFFHYCCAFNYLTLVLLFSVYALAAKTQTHSEGRYSVGQYPENWYFEANTLRPILCRLILWGRYSADWYFEANTLQANTSRLILRRMILRGRYSTTELRGWYSTVKYSIAWYFVDNTPQEELHDFSVFSVGSPDLQPNFIFL